MSVEAWEHLHNLSTYSCLGWLQYPPRLDILLYIISRLGSIRWGLASYSILYHDICRGLACYSISYHALAVFAEAWHVILYLITPWQYPLRLDILFYILSCLNSSIYHALAVSAEAWHAILYLITPWQWYPPRLGMLFYILWRLGSISRGYIFSRLGSIRWGLLFYILTWATKAQLQRTATYRHSGVRGACWHAEEVVDFASGREYSIG